MLKEAQADREKERKRKENEIIASVMQFGIIIARRNYQYVELGQAKHFAVRLNIHEKDRLTVCGF